MQEVREVIVIIFSVHKFYCGYQRYMGNHIARTYITSQQSISRLLHVEQQPCRAPAELNHEIVPPFGPSTLNPKETETLKPQGYQS